jgi:hypothetical protein
MNLALKSKSFFKDMPYTTPGLGDRVHAILTAYLISKGKPITIHLTHDKFGKDHKKVSWNQLCSMVPNVRVMVWPVNDMEEKDWLSYLKKQGFNCDSYYYGDINLPNRNTGTIDIGFLFDNLPCIEPVDCSDFFPKLPEKFATIQFDSTDKSRNTKDVDLIKQKFIDQGYTLFAIGGQAKHEKLRDSLPHIGYLMSKADIHIGVDSGMFHLAQLYKPWNKIHIHKGSFVSHHLTRAIRNGINLL